MATLCYSRHTFVAMFLRGRQSARWQGLEDAFRHVGGTTPQVLVDDARALVNEHDVQTRGVHVNDRVHAFCRYWKVTRAPARRGARNPKARTNAVSAMSSATPSPGMASRPRNNFRLT